MTLSEQGWLKATAKDPCGLTLQDSVYVSIIKGSLVVTNDTVLIGETAVLTATGENVEWYADAAGKEKVHQGNTLTIANVQSSMTYYARAGSTQGYQFELLGEQQIPVSNQYSSDNVDAGLYLNVYRDLVLHSFRVQTDKAGIRRFLLISYKGDTLLSKDVMIPAGLPTLVELNAHIPAGTYYQLKTDHELNMANFGHVGPRLVRTGDSVHYPYASGNYAEIPTSIKGATAYYYFYNLLLSDGGIDCYSDYLPVSVVIRPTSVVDEVIGSIRILPNPVQQYLTIESDAAVMAYLTDMAGRVMKQEAIKKGHQIWDLTSIQPGMYVLKAGQKRAKVLISR